MFSIHKSFHFFQRMKYPGFSYFGKRINIFFLLSIHWSGKSHDGKKIIIRYPSSLLRSFIYARATTQKRAILMNMANMAEMALANFRIFGIFARIAIFVKRDPFSNLIWIFAKTIAIFSPDAPFLSHCQICHFLSKSPPLKGSLWTSHYKFATSLVNFRQIRHFHHIRHFH